jgi:methyltransferase (TIGR00027 family)
MSEIYPNKDLLGSTARWTAAVRGQESLREDRLFHDPLATLLAGTEKELVKQTAADQEGNTIAIVVRTRFFDDFLLRVTTEYQIRQVVLMAAGLDTRAFRLSWPQQTRLFELDQPQVLAYKEQVLASAGAIPTCERTIIKVDLTETWTDTLRESGFDPDQPSVWLLEGFLFYLPTASEIRILDEVSSLASPGSWVGFDAINSEMLTSEWTRSWIEAIAKAGVPWQGVLDDPEKFMAERGWIATLHQAGDEDINHGRWPYPVMPLSIPNMPRDWFVTARKEQS